MIVTLSGITGTGKSFFKNIISKELNFKNLVIVTTRPKRQKEVNGIDKEFVNDKQFEEMKRQGEFAMDFEFLGAKYAYRTEKMLNDENQVTEVHYNTIYDFKKNAKNVFSIYMIPNDIKRAKIELRKRNLPREVEEKRLKEIEEHINEYSKNQDLQKQFDYVFINDYTEKSKNRLLHIIREKIKEEKMELLDVLDENGNITGQKEERNIIHEKGLWHTHVGVWIMNKKGELLLQKRAPTKNNPNKWTRTGGHVDAGETPLQGIQREVQEEIGVTIPLEKFELINIKKVERISGGNNFTYSYFANVDYKIDEYTIQKEEVSDLKYMSIEDMEQAVKNNDSSYTFIKWENIEEKIRDLKNRRKEMVNI